MGICLRKDWKLGLLTNESYELPMRSGALRSRFGPVSV
jgi:hypothetical protein